MKEELNRVRFLMTGRQCILMIQNIYSRIDEGNLDFMVNFETL